MILLNLSSGIIIELYYMLYYTLLYINLVSQMKILFHDLITDTVEKTPNAVAVEHKDVSLTYSELSTFIKAAAGLYVELGLQKDERIAIYLDKCPECVFAMFGATLAAGIFVPINSVLKPEQVAYILRDCNVRILVTSSSRLNTLAKIIPDCHDLRAIITTDQPESLPGLTGLMIATWQDSRDFNLENGRRIDADIASILYTSGSTGKPKGVILSHNNMVAGAESVSQYLKNSPNDRILSVLPFSFDYGLSQLTTAFSAGATTVLLNYLLPRDVVRAVEKYRITGLAAVPPLWIQLSLLDWPDTATKSLRYITNSGGALPGATLSALKKKLRDSDIYLMYGLTEAFRSTYLPPSEIDKKPGSMGKAIPNAEIAVVRPDGTPCAPDEPGELIHRGCLVAMGYWNDKKRTAERFKPVPNQVAGATIPEYAVWSGDIVKMDSEGYFYFVGRQDDMIKTSGYRVSPSEIEEVIYATGFVDEVVALGVPHPLLGQAIVVVITPPANKEFDELALINECKANFPAYMVPADIKKRSSLPRNPNGKIDRKKLLLEIMDMFQENDR